MLDSKLYTFLQLVSSGNTTQCAKALHITQPAVSQHIKALEQQYQVQLFRREGRRLVLTEEGRRFEGLCRRLCTLDAQITREMHQAGRTTLRFGATLSIADGLMPALLPRLMERFDHVAFHMTQRNTAALLRQLEEGTLDFALLEGNFDHRSYHYLPFYTSPFVALSAPDSPYAHSRTLADTLTAPLILREPGSGTRDILEGECKAHNLTPADFAATVEIAHLPTLLGLVAAGKGVTFAYQAAAQPWIDRGALTVLPLTDFQLERAFHIVSLPGNPRRALLGEIAQFLVAHYRTP